MHNQGLLPLDNISYSLPPPVVTLPPQGYQHGSLDQLAIQPQYQLQTGQYQMQSGQYYAPVQNVTPPVDGQGSTPSQNQITSLSEAAPSTPIACTTPTSVHSTPTSSMSTVSQSAVKNEEAKNSDTEITPQKGSKTVPPELSLAEMLLPDDLNTSNGESVFLKLLKSELEKPEWKQLLASYTTKDDTTKSNAVCSEAAKPTLPQLTIQHVQQPAIQQPAIQQQ